MLELPYLPCHLRHQGAGCLTVCGFILFEVPPSKIAAGRISSDCLCNSANYSCHLTGREGRGCPETPTCNFRCLNVPSFGIAVEVWKCCLKDTLDDANKHKKVFHGFFFLPNLFSLALSSALCLKIMIKNILFFVFESMFTLLHVIFNNYIF